MATTTEHAYDVMARSQFNLQKERLRSLVEKSEKSPEAVRDSLNTTESYTYSASVSTGSFFFESLSASVTTDEGGKYDLGVSSYEWWPGSPHLGFGFPTFLSSDGFAELNYAIEELVGRQFRFAALFTGTQSSVTWQGGVGEHFGNFVGSPLGFWPIYPQDIHVAWGSGTIRAVVDHAAPHAGRG